MLKMIVKSVIDLLDSSFNLIQLKRNRVKVGKELKVQGRILLRNNGDMTLGDYVRINSNMISNPIGSWGITSLCVAKNARLVIGDRVGISNTAIYCAETINIEEDVFIGGGCRIYDTDFHSLRFEERVLYERDEGIKTKPVKLCKGCFIGAGSIILKGVTIGKYSIVGAGSVVSKSIPDGEIWAGNPATYIKKTPQ